MGGTGAREVVSRSHAILTLALVSGAALHGAVIVYAFRGDDAALVVGGLTTGGLAWATLRASLRSTQPELAWPFLAVLAGVGNAWLAWLVLCCVPTGLGHSREHIALADIPLSGVLVGGGIVGALVAIPFAAMGWLLVVSAAGAARRPTLDRPWTSAVIAGLFALACAVLSYASPLHREAPSIVPATLIIGAVGLGLALVGFAALAGRALWLARVRRGRVPGWAIVPPPAHADGAFALPTDVLPWSGTGRGAAVLARVRRVADGAYRDVTARELVARV